jgi:hypothetical protein
MDMQMHQIPVLGMDTEEVLCSRVGPGAIGHEALEARLRERGVNRVDLRPIEQEIEVGQTLQSRVQVTVALPVTVDDAITIETSEQR